MKASRLDIFPPAAVKISRIPMRDQRTARWLENGQFESMYFLLKMGIVRCYVSLTKGNPKGPGVFLTAQLLLNVNDGDGDEEK